MPESIDLKKTINLPRTGFPMKANLSSMEPRMLEKWQRMDLYARIRASRQGRPSFILHDGPPYANGHIHLGHALNKILKDFIVKSRTLLGYDSPYVPGWDCHGLPIEIKVAGKKKSGADPLAIRRQCREYAEKFVEIQKEEFKRLGIFGEWENPYLTMNFHYEAETARLLGRFVEKGNVYKGLKPVHWCIVCETALAEAEVEYAQHTSPSVYVKFPLLEAGGLASHLDGRGAAALIWTTTPWTLPANLAIAFHSDYEYSLVEVGDEVYLLAQDLVEAVVRDCGVESPLILATFQGTALEGAVFRHPWLDRPSPAVAGEHVTLEQGTGLVHTAPGHGQEDYLVGMENGLEIYNPVDNSGRFIPSVEHFGGMQVFEANAPITALLEEKGALLGKQRIEHSYPHCWRCHNPVIFRATPQWFIAMDHADLRTQSLEEIRKVKWLPGWGEERISSMVANRPDWCISRQRLWGVPITALYCKGCGEILLDRDQIERAASIFEREGADAWYQRPVEDFLSPGQACTCGSTRFEKEYDILDVWFDSGSSHWVVLNEREELSWPSDVYLEGGDQYRGWFHSSLLIAVGVAGAAPYRTVICNGWTLDTSGLAMSKSIGNVISPLDVMKENGAEILRLWVASINYMDDVRLGDEILSRLRDAYRKLRNTQRFLLGNLAGFDPDSDALPLSEMEEIDRWALARLADVSSKVEKAYRSFEFHTVYHTLYNFCIVDLSSFYLDILKDRLYVLSADSKARRAAQTSLFQITDTLVRLLAPILPFTSEEVWESLYADRPAPAESVHMAEFRASVEGYRDDPLLSRWLRLQNIREEALKALEEARQRKEIGNSLEAMLTLTASAGTLDYLNSFRNLRFMFLVSEISLQEQGDLAEDEVRIQVSRAPGQKCERCWNYRLSVGSHTNLPQVCSRCYSILQEMDAMAENEG